MLEAALTKTQNISIKNNGNEEVHGPGTKGERVTKAIE